MKTNKILTYITFPVVLAVMLMACEDDRELAILSSDSDNFVNPVLQNSETMDAVELLPENATDLFEKYTWTKADYGILLPVNYVLEMDISDEFNSPVELAKTASTSADITVEDFNDAVLALGLPAFQESSVKIRTKALVTGGKVDTIVSPTLTRTVTTYQLSDCGDFCAMGIIGSATKGGWDKDTDMRLSDVTRVDRNTWTATLYLIGGEKVKFRANDSWDSNWGGADFPSGTGEAGGPDITVGAAGYYKVVFNDKTGEYTFTLLGATAYTTVGVIGSGTVGGWDTDTDLTQDANDSHLWTGQVTLTDGEAKFRANDAWDANWGSDTYPSGFGIGNGPNIPVTAGTYYVWFHDVTGEYAFMQNAEKDPFIGIGIIGTATANGWDSDTDLVQNPTNPYRWSAVITLNDGEAKFRANDAWDTNWGGVDLPSGVGVKGGPNFVIKGAKYMLHFHSGTGEYYFLK